MRFICLLPVLLLVIVIGGVLTGLLFHLPFSRFWATLTAPETLFALRLTMLTSCAATLIAVLFGLPTGYFLARRTFSGKIFIDTLIDLPMTMTPLVAGVGLLFLLGNSTTCQLLDFLGIELLFTPAGAILAQALIATPIMVRTSRSAFAAMDNRFEQVGQTMGLRPVQVFMHICLPMTRPVILSGIVLCWARAMGEFGATLMVAGATRFKTETLPLAVYLNISTGETGIALICAWLLIMTGFFFLLIMRWIRPPHWLENTAARIDT